MTEEYSSKDKFNLEADDINIVDASAWNLTYRDDGADVLVRDFRDLVEYLTQDEPSDDLELLLRRFVARVTPAQVRDMPSELRDDLMELGYTLP